MSEKNEPLPVTVQDDEVYERATPGERADYVAHAEERAGLDRAGEEVGLPPPAPVDEAAQEQERAAKKDARKSKRAAKRARE